MVKANSPHAPSALQIITRSSHSCFGGRLISIIGYTRACKWSTSYAPICFFVYISVHKTDQLCYFVAVRALTPNQYTNLLRGQDVNPHIQETIRFSIRCRLFPCINSTHRKHVIPTTIIRSLTCIGKKTNESGRSDRESRERVSPQV